MFQQLFKVLKRKYPFYMQSSTGLRMISAFSVTPNVHKKKKNNNDPILGSLYLKYLFTLHPNCIPTGNTVGM